MIGAARCWIPCEYHGHGPTQGPQPPLRGRGTEAIRRAKLPAGKTPESSDPCAPSGSEPAEGSTI